MRKKPAKSAKRKNTLAQKKRPSKSKKRQIVKSPPTQPFPVVAIGASAGGLEASSQLLQNLSGDLGMAYVFVHHLSPLYDSHLGEILQRHTAMPVSKVTDNLKVEVNHVYVIPPDKFMTIEGGHLLLRKRTTEDVHAIDYFMNALASAYRQHAIGVLLSGTDSDGTTGLRSIKREGGVTFAQDETAEHHQMPSNAMDAGYVDYVLPPKDIAEELGMLVRDGGAVPKDAVTKNEKQIRKILLVVLQKFGVDFFSHYKRTTVNRRIMRRMALNNIDNFDAYVRKLRNDQHELESLYNDFLINVTNFFREPSFYSGLRKNVFPQLVKSRKPSDAIRIWIPGCATGEESYSTAIEITEFLEAKKVSIPVQIFSTDLAEKAIAKARQGVYNKNDISRISKERLERFFIKIDGHYQINKSIRDMCVFSVHNLMKDPPFSRIDLVSCQNVLIYIEASPQKKILQAFHYALKPTGFLLLGKSETIGNATDLFEPLETETRLYRKKNQTKFSALDFSIHGHSIPPVIPQNIPVQRTVADVEIEFDKILLARYVPASVLVNKDLDILRFRGSTSPIFQPASGKASLNLLKMLRDELIFEMRRLFQKAKKSSGFVSKEGIAVDAINQFVSIEIAPLKTGQELYYLIIFRLQPGPQQVKIPGAKKGQSQSRILKLEQALIDARNELRTITEDFDATREELQSANEEILSSNEELQSINEELETSKEELQSANEELTTINEELQNRVQELKQSRDYILAIIETMHGLLLVVGAQMRVRTANKAFYEFFRLKHEETDGRMIHELANGQWDIPALSSQLRDLLPGKISFKNFEITHDFPRIGKRTMLISAHLLTQTGSEPQILLAFQDITEFRNNEERLKEAQQQLKLALQGGSVGTWAWDLKTDAVTGSREEVLLFGLENGDFFKTMSEWEKTFYPDDLPYVRQNLQRSITEKKPLDIEFRIIQKNGQVRWLLSKANTYYNVKGVAYSLVGVHIDITERKQAIEALAESEKRFHTLSDQAPVMIWMTDDKQNCNFVNTTWLSFTGKSIQDETGAGWYSGIHPDDKDEFLLIYNDAYRNHKEFRTDYRLRRHDGTYRWVMAQGVPRYTNRENFVGYIGTCVDITDRIELERQKDDFMGIASHELKTPVTSIKAYAQILHEKFAKLNDTETASMLARLDNQADKLTGLINTLLDVARIQSGQMEYDPEYFEAGAFVQEISEEMQRTTSRHKIITEVKVQGDKKVFGDRARLGQVMSNLISNAIKYSPDKDKIIVGVHAHGNEINFTVEDFGIGIDKDMHERIFERFYRVSEDSGNRVSGLGLGLFISAQIIHQQGGKIWVDSEVGKGSRFSFSLPSPD